VRQTKSPQSEVTSSVADSAEHEFKCLNQLVNRRLNNIVLVSGSLLANSLENFILARLMVTLRDFSDVIIKLGLNNLLIRVVHVFELNVTLDHALMLALLVFFVLQGRLHQQHPWNTYDCSQGQKHVENTLSCE